MIDVHTHILPCLDDGAKNKAESLEILNMLQQQGVTEVALTPHYYGKKQSVDDFLRLREQTFQELQNEVRYVSVHLQQNDKRLERYS